MKAVLQEQVVPAERTLLPVEDPVHVLMTVTPVTEGNSAQSPNTTPF